MVITRAKRHIVDGNICVLKLNLSCDKYAATTGVYINCKII